MSIDREELIDCLIRAGSENDADALTATREAEAMLAHAGLEWEQVIAKGLKARRTGAAQPDADDQSVRKAIETLLAKPDLSESAAEDMRDFLADLDKDELDPGDRKYVLSLYARVM